MKSIYRISSILGEKGKYRYDGWYNSVERKKWKKKYW